VRPDPVVPDRIECNHVAVVFDLFRVAGRQSREPTHLHPHIEIVPLGMDVLTCAKNFFSIRHYQPNARAWDIGSLQVIGVHGQEAGQIRNAVSKLVQVILHHFPQA
jgi:hypothetical protein